MKTTAAIEIENNVTREWEEFEFPIDLDHDLNFDLLSTTGKNTHTGEKKEFAESEIRPLICDYITRYDLPYIKQIEKEEMERDI